MPAAVRWVLDFPRKHPFITGLAGVYMFLESAWSGISSEPFFVWMLQRWPFPAPRVPVPGWLGAFFNQTLSAVVGGLLVAIAYNVMRGTARLVVEFENAPPFVLERGADTARYNIAVRNRGPSAASNVEAFLDAITPPLTEGVFWGEYPYRLAVCERNWEYGHLYEQGRYVSPRNQERFLLFTAIKRSDDGRFTLKGINTKGRYERAPGLIHENPVHIGEGEDWLLSYKATAANAKPQGFQFKIAVSNGQLIVQQLSG